jgi:hypothetical protein
MKDHDTCGYVGLTNRCGLHQATVERLGEGTPTHSTLTKIQLESSIECQFDTFCF